MELVLVRPNVAAIVGHEDRQIADDRDPTLVRVPFECKPLAIKLKLHELLELDLLVKLVAPAAERIRLTAARLRLPERPSHQAMGRLDRLKKGIVVEPGGV